MASAAIWAYWARCLNGTGKASPTTPNISLSSSIAPASCQLALALPHAIRPQANQVIRHPRPRPENHVRQSAPCLVVALPVALSARLSLLSLGRYLPGNQRPAIPSQQ